MTRREFTRASLAAMASLAGTSTFLSACGNGSSGGGSGRGDSKELTIVSFGGSYNETIQKVFVDPFERGNPEVKVSLIEGASFPRMKSQVEAGNVTWDLIDLGGSEFEVGVRDDLLEPYDYNVIGTKNLPQELVKDHGVKFALFTHGRAWNTDDPGAEAAGESWASMWDVGAYPAKRGLSNEGVAFGPILEVALLADGVPMDQVYPLDVDRALSSLDKLGKQNIIWWASAPEGIERLISRETPIAAAWDGRVYVARTSDDAPLMFTPNEGVVQGGYWGVPKGAPHADAAMKFLNFVFNDPDAAAMYTEETGYATTNLSGLDKLPPDVVKLLPTSPEMQGKILYQDDAWWADANNAETTTKKFQEWLLR